MLPFPRRYWCLVAEGLIHLDFLNRPPSPPGGPNSQQASECALFLIGDTKPFTMRPQRGPLPCLKWGSKGGNIVQSWVLLMELGWGGGPGLPGLGGSFHAGCVSGAGRAIP